MKDKIMSTSTKKNEDEVVDEKTWIDFFEKLQVENADDFQSFNQILSAFVQEHAKESACITVEDLQTILKEIRIRVNQYLLFL